MLKCVCVSLCKNGSVCYAFLYSYCLLGDYGRILKVLSVQMYVNVFFCAVVQRSEFNSCSRMALHKTYLVVVFKYSCKHSTVKDATDKICRKETKLLC